MGHKKQFMRFEGLPSIGTELSTLPFEKREKFGFGGSKKRL
jgi:hypothetical protein